jgi:hypothetical protein
MRLLSAAVCGLGSLAAAGTSLPTLDHLGPLLKEVIQQQRRLDGRAVCDVDYVATVKTWTRWFDRKGRLKSSETVTYDVYPAVPKSILVQTEANGVLTEGGKLEKERDKAVKAMEGFLATKAKGAGNVHEFENAPGFRMEMGVYGILRNAEFFDVAADSLDGRPMIRLSFRPKQGYTDPKKILDRVEGTLWVDQMDRVVAKANAWPVGTKAQDGLFFEMYHRKVFPDMWALAYFRLNPGVQPERFGNERFDFSFEVANFQRFSVEKGQLDQAR